MIGWFKWKGQDSRNFGILLSNLVPVIKPEERVNHVTIPGRGGELTITEGKDVYKSYIQTITVYTQTEYLQKASEWLKGGGYVTFYTEAEKRQKARIIGAVTFNRESMDSDWWTGDIQFYCDPYKQLVNGEPSVTLTSNGNVVNDGEIVAYPVITFDCASNAKVTIKVNNIPMEIDLAGTSLNGGIIDAENGFVTSKDGNTNIGHCFTGEFPVLNVGTNTIDIGSATSVVINRNRRWIL